MADQIIEPRPASGFRGIWYGNQPMGPPYGFKYSGGLGTYPQQHAPIAVHRPEVGRTYFVFGSSTADHLPANDHKQAGGESPGDTIGTISYFDHATGQLAQPRELIVRDRLDAHENPVLCVDPAGHLLVFCPAHGCRRPSYLLRSREPHAIEAFDVVGEFPVGDNFSYPQPWWIDDHGAVFLHTLYEDNQRRLGVYTSPDGAGWSSWADRRITVRMARGSYQVSWPDGRGGVGTTFDLHPDTAEGAPLNHRTNLYYMHTPDGGRTWTTADGTPINLPLADTHNPALVYDAEREGKLVYLKDLQYDEAGRPVIVYLTSATAWPGPEGGPHEWWLLRHDGQAWQHHRITESTHCYDHGSLLLLGPDDWRLIAPTAPGPDVYASGGEMVLWQSSDQGRTWSARRTITQGSPRNHTYARRPLDAHRGFACLWADGGGYEPSPSSLYFCDAEGNAYRMPDRCDAPFVDPTPLASP